MRFNRSTAMGALHPILFFAGVYVVVLLFSIFICSTIFYSCNAAKASVVKKTQQVSPATSNATASLADLK
ncbi:MAG TPA: hypothetical protein VFP87_14035 [Chitinophagaceae bacterium]|nr:hypothetical protein [Chitinophagaceae bacterium]